ncbi:hypothetical protein V5799_013226 [Amblyomma americanum]|uniref:Uncharacterized protein n=1 Tax=Amblyomma americanum TaxID=6943 RepID=A0AAQ4E6H8_AMBAM
MDKCSSEDFMGLMLLLTAKVKGRVYLGQQTINAAWPSCHLYHLNQLTGLVCCATLLFGGTSSVELMVAAVA